ncbi:MAG TPA: purine-nucleoside phosphorylase, partial [Epsilonproteobacteria bacterium]|nr:purine-nucleoside phosphorylase [Campylobacterota bacterium]
MIVCAGRIEQFAFARPVGIGMIESAITLTQLCIEEKPEEILFVGTAGAYGKHRIFDIVSSHTAA